MCATRKCFHVCVLCVCFWFAFCYPLLWSQKFDFHCSTPAASQRQQQQFVNYRAIIGSTALVGACKFYKARLPFMVLRAEPSHTGGSQIDSEIGCESDNEPQVYLVLDWCAIFYALERSGGSGFADCCLVCEYINYTVIKCVTQCGKFSATLF